MPRTLLSDSTNGSRRALIDFAPDCLQTAESLTCNEADRNNTASRKAVFKLQLGFAL